MLLTVNIIRFMWLMCRKICLPRLLCRQTKKFGKHYLVVPLLSLLVSTLFSDWRRTLPSKFFDTQVPLVPSKNSCSLVTLTVPSLVFAATRTRRLLSSYFSRIGRIENYSYSACSHPTQDTSHLILHCPAQNSLRHLLFVDPFSTTAGPGPRMLPGFGGSMVFRHTPIARKGLNNNNKRMNY